MAPVLSPPEATPRPPAATMRSPSGEEPAKQAPWERSAPDAATSRAARSPQTKKSRRRVPLTAEATLVLREHRKKLLSERLYRADGFVFPSNTGGTLSHGNVQRRGVRAGPREGGLARARDLR